MLSWKEKLAGQMPPEYEKDIEFFETQMHLRQKGKIEDKVFAETRLRRGAYGQRYDNGQRHDGVQTQQIKFPGDKETKGPDTLWDAPGMIRIKIPYGGMNPEQMELLADVAEEYSDGISHITTRQDIQFHYMHIENTPDLMRRLASVDISTIEACGNSVRNITACPFSGVCKGESFDVTPYAEASFRFLLGHPDVQDFGRKFKIAFSGCAHSPCGLAKIHDLGLVATTWQEDGVEKRGFQVYVGGGLGTVPHQAKVFEESLPVEELLPITQAISRVYARLGEKANRNRARIKFLVAKLGIDEFRRLVLEERKILPEDARWTEYLGKISEHEETPLKDPTPLVKENLPIGFEEWYQSNISQQRQEGYVVATLNLPLGDITSDQLRGLSDIARKYIRGTVRTTVEQNIVLRWINEGDLVELYHDLAELKLHSFGAGTIVDVTSCPGTDTCKLGIAASRGLAGELRERLALQSYKMDDAIKELRIKVSGCFNSCGQHHIADIGFFGNSRTVQGYKVPHFQVVLGGKWSENGGAYGLAIGAIPSKRIPEVLDLITNGYLKGREKGEPFHEFTARIGRKALKALISQVSPLPSHEEDASYYSDWGDPREYTIADIGIGECAGEVVTLVEFDLAAAEGGVFDAQIKLEEGDFQGANELAFHSMVKAARGLVKKQFLDIPEDPDTVVEEFRKRYYDTEIFFDPYAKGKFAQYLFTRHAKPPQEYTEDNARYLVEEAQLFIEASYACDARMAESA